MTCNHILVNAMTFVLICARGPLGQQRRRQLRRIAEGRAEDGTDTDGTDSDANDSDFWLQSQLSNKNIFLIRFSLERSVGVLRGFTGKPQIR